MIVLNGASTILVIGLSILKVQYLPLYMVKIVNYTYMLYGRIQNCGFPIWIMDLAELDELD